MRWTQQDYDNMQKLVDEGHSERAALRELGIPRGSLGTLKKRFGPSMNGGTEVREESPIGSPHASPLSKDRFGPQATD